MPRERKEVFLVPVADMFNHKTRENPEDKIADYEWDGETFSLVTYDHYKKGSTVIASLTVVGEQIFICYGDKTNIHLLTGYGFINPKDHVNHETKIYIPTSELEPNLASWQSKREIMKVFGLNPLTVDVTTAGVSSTFVCSAYRSD